jgi:stress-induced morphogen
MAIKQVEIEILLKEGFPDADICVQDLAGDDNHFSAKIKSAQFKGKSRVQQHQMVYNALKGKMGNELHALALTTEEK